MPLYLGSNRVAIAKPSSGSGGGGTATLQTKSKTYTPTTSQQTDTVSPDSGYDGLSSVNVTVNAMPSGTAGTPSATKGTVSNHSVSVTPSVTNTTGYITGGTKSGIAVTVSASELVFGSETKTANGTYDVTNLASLVVNVSGGGGASNVVTGTFTGTTTGAAMDITIPYSGTGYPIAIDVCVSEGARNGNGTFYNTLQRYAVVFWAGNKENTETPTYVNGYSPSFFTYACRYKSSDTTASTTANSGGTQASTLANINASASRDLVVRMKSPTVMSVYIASTSYGFMANTEYTYHIMYSS